VDYWDHDRDDGRGKQRPICPESRLERRVRKGGKVQTGLRGGPSGGGVMEIMVRTTHLIHFSAVRPSGKGQRNWEKKPNLYGKADRGIAGGGA